MSVNTAPVSRAVALAPSQLMRPAAQPPQALAQLLTEARLYVASGLLPRSVNTPEKAVLIMVAGRELGIPATYALRNIHVIEGRPTCSAELMLALVKRNHDRDAIHVAVSTDQECVVRVRDGRHQAEYRWTLADAERAGLASKDNWKRYPRAMLRSRAISEACRATFPDSIGGMYTAEELNAPVQFTDQGEVLVLEPLPEVPAASADLAAAWDEMVDPADVDRPGLQVLFTGPSLVERVQQLVVRAQRELSLDEADIARLLGGLREYLRAHPRLSLEEVYARLEECVLYAVAIPGGAAAAAPEPE